MLAIFCDVAINSDPAEVEFRQNRDTLNAFAHSATSLAAGGLVGGITLFTLGDADTLAMIKALHAQELALCLVERRLMTAEEKSKRAYDKEQAIIEAAKAKSKYAALGAGAFGEEEDEFAGMSAMEKRRLREGEAEKNASAEKLISKEFRCNTRRGTVLACSRRSLPSREQRCLCGMFVRIPISPRPPSVPLPRTP